MTEPLDLEPITQAHAEWSRLEDTCQECALSDYIPLLVAEVERLRSVLDYIDDLYGVAGIAYRALQGRSLEEIQTLHENRD